MIKKPLLFACTCFITASAAAAHAVVPADNKIEFEILRNDSTFGSHIVEFSKNASGETVVDIAISMDYSLGPITLFNYDHKNREIWNKDQMLSVSSETDDDGKDYRVEALWNESSVKVSANGENYEASPGIYSTSYWNKISLEADQLLNTQKGQLEDIEVTPIQSREMNVAGEPRMADGYQVKASVPLKIWYDRKTKQWIGLEFEIRGSQMVYNRLDPVEGTKSEEGSNEQF